MEATAEAFQFRVAIFEKRYEIKDHRCIFFDLIYDVKQFLRTLFCFFVFSLHLFF